MADESFKEFVLDQLRALPDVRARAMFGAHGLYQDEHFFGILDEGRLFFKTDAQSQADYVARGMEPFTYESKGRTLTMSYHEVPLDVLENALELVAWARRAIELAPAAGNLPGNRPARTKEISSARRCNGCARGSSPRRPPSEANPDGPPSRPPAGPRHPANWPQSRSRSRRIRRQLFPL